jgi:hypothetical protein
LHYTHYLSVRDSLSPAFYQDSVIDYRNRQALMVGINDQHRMQRLRLTGGVDNGRYDGIFAVALFR